MEGHVVRKRMLLLPQRAGAESICFNIYNILLCVRHLSMLSLRGGGAWTYLGHLTSIAFPTLRNLTKNLCPRVGTFAFSVRRNGTKSHCTMCSSVL